MLYGHCTGCGQSTDVVRGLNVCADCATDAFHDRAATVRVAAIAKRETRFLANKKRRAPVYN